jgi:hypothetical protein
MNRQASSTLRDQVQVLAHEDDKRSEFWNANRKSSGRYVYPGYKSPDCFRKVQGLFSDILFFCYRPSAVHVYDFPYKSAYDLLQIW